ncbi:GNAT family N-acetyltransferase [Alkalicoccus daliensis]|uniref:Ribosomal-protein-serine acetyltransferase n=1 Tax=Alkalicoccus daliensis TaxID=745820 RepID=A0A1G9ZCH6_9BACI|nr:GNAT family protein [Alkalicoccus daliensis]SDN18974.1 ribosomal-protein-serine acetyltransferase [Alkalicoccus daliensis]
MFKYSVDSDISMKLLQERHTQELYRLTDSSRDSLREWLPWVDFINSAEDSGKFIQQALQQLAENNGFQAGIWFEDKLAGVIGMHYINWANKETSLGYWLGKDFEGKGIMTKSCKAIVDHCFNELHLNRIEIRAAVQNYKSNAVPERLHFQKEGTVRQAEWLYDYFADHNVYGLIKEDWK